MLRKTAASTGRAGGGLTLAPPAPAPPQFIEGRGTIVDAHTVDVDGTRYTARNILVATGGRPSLPDCPGARELGITSDDALTLPERPRRICIVGGGYIALEFACIFRGFGSEVDLVFRQDLPLRGFDEDVRAFVARIMIACHLLITTRSAPCGARSRG